MNLRIFRYNPKVDKKPYMKTYELDLEKAGCIMILDALKYIKDHVDDSLSFRRSCSEGVCGSDALNVNGKNRLACITKITDVVSDPNGTMEIRPLPGMPVIRDLVPNMEQFEQNYKKVKPFLQNNTTPPSKERLQTPAARAKLDGLYECILCGCCSAACPSYWWNPDKFRGPAALLQAARFILDDRDTAKQERLEDLDDAYSAFRCRSIMSCVDVCPKGLNPTQAIAQIRSEMLKDGT